MVRFAAQLIALFLPLYAFGLWAMGPVRRYFYVEQGQWLIGIIYLLAGLAVLALVEGVLLKLWLLPGWARFLSERLYAGSYLPENDPLATLARRIAAEHRHDLLPELIRMVEADPCRVRAWLELARLLEDELHDIPQAVQQLLRGAKAVPEAEDAALLMWRAATLSQKHETTAPRAASLFRSTADLYPLTTYGKLAAARCSK